MYTWFTWGRMRERALGKPRHSWKDNIKTDNQEVGWGCMDWIDLAQDREVADTCECNNVPSGFINTGHFLASCTPVSYSRRTLLHGV
jgi:hypothetical protein